MGKKKVKAPSGLSVSRHDWTLKFSWSKGGKYKDQDLQYYLKETKKKGRKRRSVTRKYKSIDLSGSTRKKAVALNPDSFYPTNGKTITSVQFRVVAKANGRRYKSGLCKQHIYKPYSPSLSAFSLSDSTENTGTFSWSANKDSEWRIFTRDYWQTMLVASDVSSGSRLTWKKTSTNEFESGTSTSSGSKTITETNTGLTSGTVAYVRWFRMKAQGPAGDSKWVYKYHAYSTPYAPTDVSATLSNGYLSAQWTAEASFSRPIDSMTLQWMIVTPAAGCTVPSSETSWTDGYTLNDKDRISATKDTYTGGFTLDSAVGEDQALFVRTKSVHDKRAAYSDPCLVSGGVGSLKTPTITSVDVNAGTKSATVSFTNNSEVPDSKINIYLQASDGTNLLLGTAEHGTTSLTVTWTGDYSTYVFGAQAVTDYQSSAITMQDGDVPVAPSSVSAEAVGGHDGTVRVSWDWTWSDAESATISWADHDDAWESTDEPSTYTVKSINASHWNISGLDTGVTWYFRVRLDAGSGDDATHGPWSDIVSVNLSSTPTTPSVTLSKKVVAADESFTVSWAYASSDGTSQQSASICEATIADDGTITYGDPISATGSSQTVTLNPASFRWSTGTTHYICVRVVSSSNIPSDGWSAPAIISVADPPTATVTLPESDCWSTLEIADDDDDTTITHSATVLTQMPVNVSVGGAGVSGSCTLAIERVGNYMLDRPDESEMEGFDGETIAVKTMDTPGTDPYAFSFDEDDLIGSLDDGAKYKLVATVADSLGQSSDPVEVEFEVHWTHQAEAPTATVTIDTDYLAAQITPTAPTSYVDGDVCDIYRLSQDPPELIVSGGTFGTTYVDPYPAFGDSCGHRVVDRTSNGDYKTSDDEFAWIDLDEEDGDIVDCKSIVIDFGDDRVELPYDIELENSWEKDFKRTSYLGGSVQGDWNPAVTRDLSASTDTVVSEDPDTITAMRRLAEYPGICHVRTPEGSSFAADVQVSESRSVENKVAEFSLTIKRIDTEGYDGVTLTEWQKIIGGTE